MRGTNETCAYENGACVFTEMDYKEKDQAVFTIHPAQGKTELIPAKRAYTVEFCNFAQTGTDTVKVLVNGAETEAAVKYERSFRRSVWKWKQTQRQRCRSFLQER